MTEISHPAAASHEHYRTRRALMLMAALGIVYGDIGTSPLYAFKVALEAAGWVAGGAPPGLVLGVLSLIFWSLVITISVKYIGFVLRADNEGEGGILALTGLLCRDRLKGLVLALGLFGSALLYGDAVITPAISVLSAFEGLETAAPQLQHFVVPLTVIVLVGFFLLQSRGTARIAKLFGPVMLTWFATIGILGAVAIVRHPQVLVALSPVYAVHFVTNSSGTALAVCGAVFLAVTGGEALYADMGHIGRLPIARAWGVLVLPALGLSYFGQGAVVLNSNTLLDNPFFSLAPSHLVIPLVILSAMATVIASQAVVTGVFSLTKQAVQLGSLPRIRVIQTSGAEYGQIYIPSLNWMLAIGTIMLTVLFKNSGNLAAAYGVAVSATMTITTILLYRAMKEVWHWRAWAAFLVAGAFLVIDCFFLIANLTKVAEGGWLPLAMGGGVFLMMRIWVTGADACRQQLGRLAEPFDTFLARLDDPKVVRLPGCGVFLTRNRGLAPPMLINQLKWHHALNETIILMSFEVQRVPRIHARDRLVIEPIGKGITRVIANYGFMQTPNVHVVMRWLPMVTGLDVDPNEALYYLWNEAVYRAPEGSVMPPLGVMIFAFLRRNAARASDYFGLPQERVVEVGIHIEI
jgi:KUP system potassium uptake protein